VARSADSGPLDDQGLWPDAGGRRTLRGMAEQAVRPLVLVDVRPTECGYRALIWALQEAERRDAHLLAVTVWPGDPTEPDEGRAEMEQALAGMVERAVEETGVHGRTSVAAVTHPVTVAEVAVRIGAELLVVGSEEAVVG
jgi:nucleotide-binding universal stress UspA family protein